jgi:hypothetical protein
MLCHTSNIALQSIFSNLFHIMTLMSKHIKFPISTSFLSHLNNTYFYFFLIFLTSFNKKVIKVCEDISGQLARLPIFFGGLGLLSMEDCAPYVCIGSWALMVPYLCSTFCIFNRPVLEEYVFQVESGPYLL